MEGHKDISDMSFEEFFSEPPKVRREDVEPAPVRRQPAKRPDVPRGFGGSSPKINYKDGRFYLYVPRYTGADTDRFEAAVDCSAGVVPLQRLESVRRQGGRVTRAATLDLTAAGVSPLEQFRLLIDGDEVYTNKKRDLLFFNNIGLPLGRPVGDVTAVHAEGVRLRTVKTEVLETVVRDGIAIEHMDVSVAGGVWIDDRKGQDAPEADVGPEQEAAKPEPKPKKAHAKTQKRTKVKAVVSVPTGSKDAHILYGGEVLPLFTESPEATIDIEGCDYGECAVRAEDMSGAIVFGKVPAERTLQIRTASAQGPMKVVVERDGKDLASVSYFVIPDFKCQYSGKGDIPDDPNFTFTMFGEDYTRSVFDDDARGPFRYGDASYAVIWNIPAVTYDIGEGPHPYAPFEIDVDDLRADSIKVTVRGARKKKLFFGGEKGKKRDVSPEWDNDSLTVDLSRIKAEIYAAPGSTFCFFISVNSCPNRKFITITNPVRLTAVYEDGVIRADVGSASMETVCRIYNIDKSVDEVRLDQGHNEVPVGADAVEAEITQTRGGTVCGTLPVRIRAMPFLMKDQTGDYWLHVSRDKRIPLPDGLMVNGQPDLAAVRAWHDRIVRMNPELKGVTFAMMQKAFEDARE